MKKEIKENQKVYCLFVNITTFYISFKIEEGKFLGKVHNYVNLKRDLKDYYAVEHTDDEVNYLKMEDIFATEKDAMKYLIKILNNKINK